MSNAVAVLKRVSCSARTPRMVGAVRPAIPSPAGRSNVLVLCFQSAGLVKIEPVVRQDSRPDPVRATALDVMKQDAKDFDVSLRCALPRLP